MFFIHHRWMVWTSLAATVVLLVYLMSTTKTGLVPGGPGCHHGERQHVSGKHAGRNNHEGDEQAGGHPEKHLR